MIHNESPPYLCQLVPPSEGNNIGNVNLCNKNKLHTICTRTVKYLKRFLPNVDCVCVIRSIIISLALYPAMVT